MRRLLVTMACIMVCGCAPPRIERFGASPQVYCPNDAVRLSWIVHGADRLQLSTVPPSGDPVAVGDGTTVVPVGVTTYRLSAFNAHGSDSKDARSGSPGNQGPQFNFVRREAFACAGGSYPNELILTLASSDLSPRLRIVSSNVSTPGIMTTVQSPAAGARLATSVWRVTRDTQLFCPADATRVNIPPPAFFSTLTVVAECGPE